MEKQFLTIAQASDLHICKDGAYAYEVADTARSLKNFLRHIKKLPFSIDVLCVTGDLSDDGSISSYSIVKESLDTLPFPYYVIPGNHDNKKNMEKVFTNLPWLQDYYGDRMVYSFSIDGKKIIFLDSIEPGEASGSITSGALEKVSKELSTGDDTLVFLHQPPFPTGIGFMDKQSYKNREEFLSLMDKFPNVMLVGCGHIHRAIFSRKGKTNFTVAPSIAMQLDLNLNDNAPGDFVFETPGYLIHRIGLTKSSFPEIATHVVQITDREEMETTYPFDD